MATEPVIFYGAEWSPESRDLRQALGARAVAYMWRNVDSPQVASELKKLSGSQTVPVLAVGSKVLKNPSVAELDAQFGQPSANYHDVVIVGGGPTALAAAIYTTREDIDTVILEKGVVGGLAAVTDSIENYPGFPKGVSGIELSSNLRAQAERFGTKIETAEVTALKDEGQYKRVSTSGGDYLARTILIATGSDHKRLGVPGEEEFYGKGVHYCATCDGPLYKDKKLVVVGGGNSAAQEAIFLTKFASHVDILIRGEHWKASEVLVENINNCKSISVHFDTVADAIEGSSTGLVGKVETHNVKTNQKQTFEAEGVFVFIGLVPNTGWLKNTQVKLDEIGFVETNRSLETSVPGIFCAGDVRSGATQQIASAVGEGATAALMMREYLKESF